VELCDEVLVQNIINGNNHDFSIIFDKYKRLIYSEARKFANDFFEIEEICQEVFIRVFKSLSLYNPEYKLSTWIITITKNFCKSKMRKRKLSFEYMEFNDVNENDLRNALTPENVIVDKEEHELLRSLVFELPQKYGQMIVLYYYEGLSYSELTEVFHVPMTTVKNRLYRAKLMLKKKLKIYETQ
jgi:RNA polymerase sigma factor (sigma-70 family)